MLLASLEEKERDHLPSRKHVAAADTASVQERSSTVELPPAVRREKYCCPLVLFIFFGNVSPNHKCNVYYYLVIKGQILNE
jgi:hypothetical protein